MLPPRTAQLFPEACYQVCSPREPHAAKAQAQAPARQPRAEPRLAGRKAPTHPEELCGKPFQPGCVISQHALDLFQHPESVKAFGASTVEAKNAEEAVLWE